MTIPSAHSNPAAAEIADRMNNRVGATASIEHRVQSSDTAANWGNELPVLATPVLLWLTEIASMRLIEADLPSGWMTVGTHHDSSHEAPTLQDRLVTVHATLAAVRGRQLVFEVQAQDDGATILRGRHHRGLVQTTKFRARLGL